jgi:hypothetical protein
MVTSTAAAGWSWRDAPGAPMTISSLIPGGSAIKPFTATSAMSLAERGLLDLDRPVTAPYLLPSAFTLVPLHQLPPSSPPLPFRPRLLPFPTTSIPWLFHHRHYHRHHSAVRSGSSSSSGRRPIIITTAHGPAISPTDHHHRRWPHPLLVHHRHLPGVRIHRPVACGAGQATAPDHVGRQQQHQQGINEDAIRNALWSCRLQRPISLQLDALPPNAGTSSFFGEGGITFSQNCG